MKRLQSSNSDLLPCRINFTKTIAILTANHQPGQQMWASPGLGRFLLLPTVEVWIRLIFVFRVKTLPVQDHHWRNLRKISFSHGIHPWIESGFYLLGVWILFGSVEAAKTAPSCSFLHTITSDSQHSWIGVDFSLRTQPWFYMQILWRGFSHGSDFIIFLAEFQVHEQEFITDFINHEFKGINSDMGPRS